MAAADNDKVLRLWDFIEYPEAWLSLRTARFDALAPSWLSYRKKLEQGSEAYAQFMEQLKREHAIETGIVERLYDLSVGVTETFIKKGFVDSYLSHGDTNVPKEQLMNHLGDHLDAVNFVFDVVKENRALSIGFIKDCHALVTRSQATAEGRDQFGNATQIPLLRGAFKERENNPIGRDGRKVLYCPPEHTASEMEKLVEIHQKLESEGAHPLIIAAWFHHTFTIIHPFQDGNGRMARLLSSLILLKHNYFPFTVLRAEHKAEYIDALQCADNGNGQDLVNFISNSELRKIETALQISIGSPASIDRAADMLSSAIKHADAKRQALEGQRAGISPITNNIENYVGTKGKQLQRKFTPTAEIRWSSSANGIKPSRARHARYLSEYAQVHNYTANDGSLQARIFLTLIFRGVTTGAGDKINLISELIFFLHQFGPDASSIALGASIIIRDQVIPPDERIAVPSRQAPFVLGLQADYADYQSELEAYIDQQITYFLSDITQRLS